MATTNYAMVSGSVIESVAVVDPATPGGEAWLAIVTPDYDQVEAISTLTPEPGIGWIRRSAGTYVPPTIFTTSTLTLAANGSNHATVTYTDNHSSPLAFVTFNVNGATATEATASGVAEITVTASAAGPVVVTCENLSITLEAE
jgi:hypothetical protein